MHKNEPYKYFGTDGIRGKANSFPITAKMAQKIAMAAAQVLQNKRTSADQQNRVIIGKDPRQSSYMLEQAMTSGFLAMGMEVILTGPLPTPSIAMLTRSLRADLGVMISASHNSYMDNGIKLFGYDGYKLEDDVEAEIEPLIDANLDEFLAPPDSLGRAWRLDDAPGRYIEFIKGSFPRRQNLSGLKLVVDCANGAAYKVAPAIFWELEAEVIPIHNAPNGKNINLKCGATDTESLQKAVIEHNADLGIALDGDADRVILVDELGQKIDGDQIIALLATHLKAQDMLVDNTVVATVMSNLGLEKFLNSKGIELVRTKVGDRYVLEYMRENRLTLGGEPSGHIVFRDYATTGDGLLAALQVLSILSESNQKASTLLKCFDPMPQIMKNVDIQGDKDAVMAASAVNDAVSASTEKLGNKGRILVRPSGTEPVIRVMAEGEDEDMLHQAVNDVCDAIAASA